MLLTTVKIENLLRETLPNVADEDVHCTAKSIIETTGKGREVPLGENLGAQYSIQCKDICAIGKAYEEGYRIRAFITEE